MLFLVTAPDWGNRNQPDASFFAVLLAGCASAPLADTGLEQAFNLRARV